MNLTGLLPLRKVLQEVGISRATLWRARHSKIKDFPEPIRHLGKVYWRKQDLPALEAALFRYEGRLVFEQVQSANRKTAKLKVKKSTRRKAHRSEGPNTGQPDLFDL